MQERVVEYCEGNFFRRFAQETIFRIIGHENQKDLIRILLDYKNTPEEDLRKGVTRLRYSHLDMYMFCVYTGMVPDSLKIGDTFHPGPGKMTFDDKQKLENFFVKNRAKICGKILVEAIDKEIFEEKKKKQFAF
jgi:hypothetical protein